MNATTESTFVPAAGVEVLPGYVLREKVGSGGFGEVWRAEAPGGLDKAVKFIFGRVDESRASSELEALERIRGLRHPFLLSTERIEIVQGTLIIVLELAEGNLKELFDKYRQDGLPGIPANELLQFLNDSADALDYLWTSQSLQHLDIKPENLMLSGGRAKIGDFGLVKQIGDEESTIMGGVTPAYAPPEVFDGRPCGFSDQYSLAIVYQELLTGQLPFRGRTAAQLAMQHTHHPPVLEPLPIPIRPVVRRALSKEPEQRYPSCHDMVVALKEATEQRIVRVKTSAKRGSAGVRQLLNEGSRESEVRNSVLLAGTVRKTNLEESLESTQILDDETQAGHTTALPTHAQSLTGTSIPLGPIHLGNELGTKLRPAIMIGIGATGLRAVSQFKKEVQDAFGHDNLLKSNPILAIDTDDRAMKDMAMGRHGAVLDSSETLRIPLRSSRDYRERGRKRLNSMSRRWLFNVPRSLRTEGIRPFGRLAFVDHYEAIVREVDRLIDQVIEARQESNDSSKNFGLPADDQPTVLLCGSICGGTCSGFVNELGYLVKDRFKKRGLSSAEVFALLTYDSIGQEKNADLAAGNALAFLVEFQGFANSSEGYRGDVAAGIPAAHSPGPPFDQVNFVHLGRGVNQGDHRRAIESLVDYMMMMVTDPGGKYVRATRTSDPKVAGRQLQIRSFAIGEASVACLVSPLIKSQYLCHQLLRYWVGSGVAEQDLAREHRDDILLWTRRSLGKLGVPLEEFSSWLQAGVLRRLGVSESKLISRCTRSAVGAALGAGDGNQGRALFERLLREIDSSLRQSFELPDGPDELLRAGRVSTSAKPVIDKAAQNFTDWQRTLVDTMKIRLPGAEFAVRSCLGMLKQSVTETGDQLTRLNSKIEGCRDAIFRELVMMLNQDPPRDHDQEEEEEAVTEDPLMTVTKLLEDYTRLRLEEACVRIAGKAYESALSRIEPNVEWVEELRLKLARLQQRFVVRKGTRGRGGQVEGIDGDDQDIGQVFGGRLPEFVERLDERITVDYFESQSQLSCFNDAVGAEQLALGRACESNAIRLVEEAPVDDANTPPLADESPQDVEEAETGEPSLTLGEAISRIAPPDAVQGRYHRVLVMTPGITPASALAGRIEEVMGTAPTVLSHQALNVTFFLESYALDISRLARYLYDDKDTRIELADRLRTRDDLD